MSLDLDLAEEEWGAEVEQAIKPEPEPQAKRCVPTAAPGLMRQKSRSIAASSHKFLSADEPRLHERLERIWSRPDRETSLKQLLADWRQGPQSMAEVLETLVDERTSGEMRLSRRSLTDLFHEDLGQEDGAPRRRHTLQGPVETVHGLHCLHDDANEKAGRCRSRTVDANSAPPPPSWTPTLPIVMASIKLRQLGARAREQATSGGEPASEKEFFTDCWHTQALATRTGSIEATIERYSAQETHDDDSAPPTPPPVRFGSPMPHPHRVCIVETPA